MRYGGLIGVRAHLAAAAAHGERCVASTPAKLDSSVCPLFTTHSGTPVLHPEAGSALKRRGRSAGVRPDTRTQVYCWTSHLGSRSRRLYFRGLYRNLEGLSMSMISPAPRWWLPGAPSSPGPPCRRPLQAAFQSSPSFTASADPDSSREQPGALSVFASRPLHPENVRC